MKYKIIERLSETDCEKLALLIDKCNGYEPFYLTGNEIKAFDNYDTNNETEYSDDYSPNELRQLAAYDDKGHMIGFISFICDENFNCCITSEEKENYYKDLSLSMPKDLPELTSLVAPKYRHRGIFSEMFSRIKAATGINAFIVSGNLKKTPAFLEYLMKLTNDEYNKCIDSKYDADTGYSFRFEARDSVYVMYDTKPAAEEIAYCRLSFQPSFTVISSVYVDEKLRGAGLGSIFMKHFITNYFSKYKKPLVLNVRNINVPALRLYKKFGFKIIETVKYYII